MDGCVCYPFAGGSVVCLFFRTARENDREKKIENESSTFGSLASITHRDIPGTPFLLPVLPYILHICTTGRRSRVESRESLRWSKYEVRPKSHKTHMLFHHLVLPNKTTRYLII